MRKFLGCVTIAAASVLMGAAGSVVTGQAALQADKCFANDYQVQRIPADQVVEACTRLLAEGSVDFTLVNEAGTLNNRGTAYLDLGKLDLAFADFNAALRIKPDGVSSLTNRGSIYLKKRNFDAAIADYSAVIGKSPNHLSAYINRGVAYLKKHDIDSAIRDFDYAKQLDRQSYAAFVNKSLALLERGDFAGANTEAAAATDLHPTYFWSYNLHCLLKASAKRDLSGAQADCNEALQRSNNNYVVYESVGLLNFQGGKYRDAVTAYDKFLAVEPNEPVALYMRGLSKRQLGDNAGADRDVAAAKALDPKVEALYMPLGSSS